MYPTKITKDQCKDTGMALVLICLLLVFFGHYRTPLIIGVFLLILTMTAPTLLKSVARIWFGTSHFLGEIASRVILTLLFFTMVMPVGLLRGLLGKDTMRIKIWKQGKDSVFRTRNHIFSEHDLEKPY